MWSSAYGESLLGKFIAILRVNLVWLVYCHEQTSPHLWRDRKTVQERKKQLHSDKQTVICEGIILSVFIIKWFYFSFLVFQICSLMGHLNCCFSLEKHFMIFLPCFVSTNFLTYIIVSLWLLTAWTHITPFSFSFTSFSSFTHSFPLSLLKYWYL